MVWLPWAESSLNAPAEVAESQTERAESAVVPTKRKFPWALQPFACTVDEQPAHTSKAMTACSAASDRDWAN